MHGFCTCLPVADEAARSGAGERAEDKNDRVNICDFRVSGRPGASGGPMG